MKRIFCIIVFIAVSMTAFSACGKQPQPLDTSSMPAAVTFESPELKCTSDESRIPEFTFIYEYGNDKESPVWLWNAKNMSNAALVELDYAENAEEPAAGEVIYTFGNVESCEGVLLYIQLGEDVSQLGFSYSSGVESFLYALSMGENGSSPILTRIQ